MIEMPTESEPVRIVEGDSLDVLPRLDPDSVDSVVTDPPYGLGFMGKDWDHSVPGGAFWGAVLRVLKPGGYMLVMGGTRTYHRLACAVEDAGFEIRDCLMWLYGSGFPKHKSRLKPAWEPILLCRKPGPTVLILGVDECRVPTDENLNGGAYAASGRRRTLAGDERTGAALGMLSPGSVTGRDFIQPSGRWPANVTHDGSDDVMKALGATARFFYCAKASRKERGEDNAHPTVKPLALMRWLVRLVTPKGGNVLDPFAGSGTTGHAAIAEGRRAVLIEIDPVHFETARERIETAMGRGRGRGSLFVT